MESAANDEEFADGPGACDRGFPSRALAGQLDGEGKKMKRSSFVLVLVLAIVIEFTCCPANAHIGSPTVFFEGMAGPYKAHVMVRPAEVVPGLAEISVRAEGPAITNVSALPIKWNAGRQGAPPPDIAKLVPGETNLYSAQLWFMEDGAH